MANNSGDGHPAVQDNLIQEDFEEDIPDLIETEQLSRTPTKKGIVFVRKIPSSLLQSVMQDNFASRQTSMLTSIDADNDSSHPELNERSETPIVDESRNQIPFVKTIIVHQKHRQTQYACQSPTSLSLTQPDENKNSILLLKAPATYVPLPATAITASKQHEHQHYQPQLQQLQQQLQTDIVYSELSEQRGLYQQQQTVGDYHHHQQHDQRKALTKLFLPNKIHVKPILHQKQLQISTANTTTTNNIPNESLTHVGVRNGSKNIVSKIKVLNLRKRFTTSATNH